MTRSRHHRRWGSQSAAAVLLAAAPVPPSSTPPAPDETAQPPTDPFVLEVDVVGTATARAQALAALAAGWESAPIDALTDAAVGRVPDVATGLAWAFGHAFSELTAPAVPVALADPLHREPAPVPGDRLLREYGVRVAAFVVRSERGKTPWPKDAADLLLDGQPWVAADLVPDRAPMFAAPAPDVPPAAERFATARRRGAVYVLGVVDRCGAEDCLRWAQVLARDGDRLIPGYLPAFQVSPTQAWVPDAAVLPRVALLRSGTHGTTARWVLLARLKGGVLHRKTIAVGEASDGFPAAALTLDGEDAVVSVDGSAPVRVPLDAGMDRRLRDDRPPAGR